MRILVTGAGGFLGRGLVARLTAGALPYERLTLWDSHLPEGWGGKGVRLLAGDLRDPAMREAAFEGGADLVFHLASVPSGRSEEQPDLSLAVNLHATLELFQAAAAQPRPPRLVFASSIAALGQLGPGPVDDDTPPRPALTYGAHKLMTEVALADMTRRGLLDGVGLRPAGILARPQTPTGQRSAFLSEVFHALKAGRPFVAPVGEGAASWLVSRPACVDAFLHAAALGPDASPPWRCFTLPALRLTFGALADAIGRALGVDARALVRFEPDEAIEANFGRYPPLATSAADALGFPRDASADELVARVLEDMATD